MLQELSIENVAVIEKAVVRFGGGLNIMTGETGAGKSILIDSINAILGNRTSREIVRSGADRAVIWATFRDVNNKTAAEVAAQGYELEDALILHREITVDGKSVCRVNGKPATAATVRAICSGLINIHGQHDNQDLLNPDRHIDILDSYADLGDTLSTYQSLYQKLTHTKSEIERLTMDESMKERRMDLLRYQIDEIEKAELREGEDTELSERRNIIRNAEKINDALRNAHAYLEGDGESGGALPMLYAASELLSGIHGISDDMDQNAVRLSDTYYVLRDITSEIRDHLDRVEFNAGDAEYVEERLDLIYRLKKKYGDTVGDILSFLENIKKELSGIESSDERLEQLRSEYARYLADAEKQAAELSVLRRAAFGRFEARIKDELSYLNMPNIAFETVCEEIPLSRMGVDKIEFFISTNIGEPPKPLAKIASGGELSRIMLAIKNALAEKDDIDTLIFDEIDSGVSGASAIRIGDKLRQSARDRQTICVTHSSQIAAYADVHLLIEKFIRSDRTFTEISRLDRAQRVAELARIISGDQVTEKALQNAEEMLTLAQA